MAKQGNKAKVTLAQSAAPTSNAPAPASNAAPQAAAPVTPPVAAPAKGAATLARWGAALKGNANGTAVATGAHIAALPLNTIITVLAPGNPKGRGSATRFAWYGSNGVAGHALTIAQYLAACVKASGTQHSAKSVQTLMYADLAWDFNHGFIGLCVPGVQPFVRGQAIVAPVVPVATQLALPAPHAAQAA